VIQLKDQELLRRLPAIRRAREFHLYDASGKRFLDMYLEGGLAWLGHRPEGLSLEIKNIVSRGVYAAYPGSEEGKLLKALTALKAILPGSHGHTSIRYYRSAHSEVLPAAIDPLYQKEGSCMLWRPGLAWPLDAESVEMLIPLPGLEYGRLIASRDETLPPGDLPSALIAGALTRCVWVLKKNLEGSVPFPPFIIPEGSPWTQQGPYCLWSGNAENYSTLFTEALELGILLSPSPDLPCILPGIQTSGDLKLLKQFFGGL
jgi:hypothetical protein